MKSKAVLSGPAGAFQQVAGEVINNENQLYYRSLNDDELLEALRQSLSGVNATSVRLTQELREHLLPALLVLRERHMQPGRRKSIPGRPTYYEVLRSLNLRPDTVRRWFQPTVSAVAVLHLLDERSKHTRPSHPPVEKSAAQLLLAAADKMAAALLHGNVEAATRLAHEYCEARNS
jgi:hypothetical protein